MSWVDPHHRIPFREDIDGHDECIAAHLFALSAAGN
jgi:hypothetical protein